MRQKDANLTARILGLEVRNADECEVEGLLFAKNAIRGHLLHTQPEFDPARYDAAFQSALHGSQDFADC